MQTIPEDWPLSTRSRLIRCRPHEWHVQSWGSGADLLYLHGAGASAHSWHRLIPHLPGYRSIAIDLPGQGFSRAGGMFRLGLDAMADDIIALCNDQEWRPVAIIGHSAGAAIALRMAEIMARPPLAVIGINAALGPFEGMAGWLFPRLARALAASPFIAQLVTRFSATPRQVEKLLASTGSVLDEQGVSLYRRLVSRPSHIEATLGMMAQWQLEPLLERLEQITIPTLLLASTGDRAVPPAVSRRAAERLPRGTYVEIPDLGHLVHEEAPEILAPHILDYLRAHDQMLTVVTD